MSVFNDDGVSLDLIIVFILFAIPNFMFILLTIFNAYMIHLSNNHLRLSIFLGDLANFFSNGALDRIIKNLIQHFEMKNQQQQQNAQIRRSHRHALMTRKTSYTAMNPPSSMSKFSYTKIYDAHYLLLVPFQIDLLLTIFVYKILTHDVYSETCQSYLETYHNRSNKVVCWLKNINRNVSNLSTNITLYQYCANQTITYFDYEHNDVICTQYVFRLINVIDTITNLFAWHQAIVFVVTKSIVFCNWYQHKLRRVPFFNNLYQYQHRISTVLFIGIILFIYVFLFIILLPVHFFLFERQRIDLTHNLLYACLKFLAAIILHVNLYTLYQWHSLNSQERRAIIKNFRNRRTSL